MTGPREMLRSTQHDRPREMLRSTQHDSQHGVMKIDRVLRVPHKRSDAIEIGDFPVAAYFAYIESGGVTKFGRFTSTEIVKRVKSKPPLGVDE